jgi:hypothetical protein
MSKSVVLHERRYIARKLQETAWTYTVTSSDYYRIVYNKPVNSNEYNA